MTSTTTSTATAVEENRTARLITDGMEPRNVIILVSLGVGLAQDNPLTGVLWAIEAILFAAAIPMAYIKFGMRTGMWDDRHIGQVQRRKLLIPVIMSSVAIGIGGMVLFDAPRAMLALVLAMLATLAVLLVPTALWKWKISVHTAVAAWRPGHARSHVGAVRLARLPARRRDRLVPDLTARPHPRADHGGRGRGHRRRRARLRSPHRRTLMRPAR